MELNASSTRNKKSLQAEVASQLGSLSLDGFVAAEVGQGGSASGRKHALIMDEVDGMAGTADKGGMQVSEAGWGCGLVGRVGGECGRVGCGLVGRVGVWTGGQGGGVDWCECLVWG